MPLNEKAIADLVARCRHLIATLDLAAEWIAGGPEFAREATETLDHAFIVADNLRKDGHEDLLVDVLTEVEVG